MGQFVIRLDFSYFGFRMYCFAALLFTQSVSIHWLRSESEMTSCYNESWNIQPDSLTPLYGVPSPPFDNI